LIGANWLILIFCTATISDKLVKSKWLKIVLGAAMMVLMDLFIETSAPLFDFWKWKLGYAPLHNFIGWFIVALIMQTVYHLAKLKGDFVFSFHLYAAQLTFFIYFFLYHLYL
jgi:bisanhydrobacterioruberin hydratase